VKREIIFQRHLEDLPSTVCNDENSSKIKPAASKKKNAPAKGESK